MTAPDTWTPADESAILNGIKNRQTPAQVAEQLGRTKEAIRSKVKRMGLVWGPIARPIPGDFELFHASHSQRQCATHYGVSNNTVMRWARQRGVSRKPSEHVTPRSQQNRPQKPKAAPIKAAGAPYLAVSSDRYERDMSPIGRAVDYLRKWGPVFYAGQGEYWRGSSRLTADEVMQRACSKGFVL